MPLTPFCFIFFYFTLLLSNFIFFSSTHVHILQDLLGPSLNLLIGRLAFSAIHSLYTTLAGLALHISLFFMT